MRLLIMQQAAVDTLCHASFFYRVTVSRHCWVWQVKQRSSAVYVFLPRCATSNRGLAQNVEGLSLLPLQGDVLGLADAERWSTRSWNWKGQFGWHIFARGHRRLVSLVYRLPASLLMLGIFRHTASMSLGCRNALNVYHWGKKRHSEIPQTCFCFFFSFAVARDKTRRGAGCHCSDLWPVLTSSVNSQNLSRNWRGCRSAGATLKLQVSLFKTRLPSNLSTLQQTRCALFPLSHWPEGCLHITSITRLANVLRAH